jgi:hypothetical protein
MFIRRARTRNKATGDAYFTHRLVASVRTDKQVRQVALLNLGRHFDLPQPGWPRLCARIEALMAAQPGLLAETNPIETNPIETNPIETNPIETNPIEPNPIEPLAQRFAARLMNDRAAAREAIPRTASPGSHGPNTAAPSPSADFAEVDTASLQLTRPRSVGVEAVGLAAIGWTGREPRKLIRAQPRSAYLDMCTRGLNARWDIQTVAIPIIIGTGELSFQHPE